jgi:hypothetical protein
VRVATRPRNPIADLLSPEDIILDLDADSKNQAFETIADFLGTSHGLDAEQVRVGLIEREALGSTGLGRGVAIPTRVSRACKERLPSSHDCAYRSRSMHLTASRYPTCWCCSFQSGRPMSI